MNSKEIKNKIILLTVVAVVVCVSLLIILVFQYAHYWQLRNEQVKVNNSLAMLQQEEELLQNEYNYKSSEQFIEDYAHNVLGWGRDGETHFKS